MAEPTLPLRVFYVYALLLADGVTPFYVGKGKGRRWLDHECPCNLRGNGHRSNVIKKLLREIGHVPKVKIADGLTEPEAHALEIKLIAIFGRHPNGPLVNKTDGGEGATDQTGEIGRKISAAKMGHEVSEETRTILRLRNLGKELKPEIGRKISLALTGYVRTPEHNEKLAASKRGKKRPPEVIAKIVASKDGWRPSPESVARGAATRTGMKRGPET